MVLSETFPFALGMTIESDQAEVPYSASEDEAFLKSTVSQVSPI